MTLVALISNPRSTGNKAMLPAVRDYCARNPDIFHYEVEEVHQIADALRAIALVKPRVLVINGGDGTVQSALTELYHGGHFEGTPPPVAVLPNGKTNLIALDLGVEGDPLEALARIMEVAKGDLSEHIVVRELIALSDGSEDARPVLGMFLGGAGLAETAPRADHPYPPVARGGELFVAAPDLPVPGAKRIDFVRAQRLGEDAAALPAFVAGLAEPDASAGPRSILHRAPRSRRDRRSPAKERLPPCGASRRSCR